MPLGLFLVLAWLANILSLAVADAIFDGVHIGHWWPLLLGAAVLGIANTIVKPILTLITLPIVILTLGLALFAINVAMLALAEWIAPRLLDRRVLDLCRRDDRRLARQLDPAQRVRAA